MPSSRGLGSWESAINDRIKVMDPGNNRLMGSIRMNLLSLQKTIDDAYTYIEKSI